MAVTRDATKGWWVPASASELTTLLTGTGISNSSFLWLCQEASGSLADSIGTCTLAPSNSPGYQATVSGWSRKAVSWVDSSTSRFDNTTVPPNGNASSLAMFGYFYVTSTPSGARYMMAMTDWAIHIFVDGSGHQGVLDNAAGIGSTVISDGVPRPFLVVYNRATSTCKMYTPTETLDGTYASSAGTRTVLGAYPALITPAGGCLYATQWTGTAAELTATQAATVLDRFMNGPAVTSVAVSPSTFTIGTVGGTQALTATATRADGTTFDVTATATWTTSDATKATVSSSGLVTATGTGTATITATYTSLNATPAVGTATAMTGGVTLTSVTVSPSSTSAPVGTAIVLTVTGHWSDSSTTNLTGSSTFADANSHTSTLFGTVACNSVGVGFVTCTSGGFSAVATIAVTIPSTDENEHHPWPGVARGIWDFDGSQVVWTGDRVMIARDGDYSLGDSVFWNRNINGASLRRGIPAFLPTQTEVIPPVTGPGSNCYVDTCLTATQRIVICADTFNGRVTLDVMDRTSGAIINHTQVGSNAPEAPRVMVSAGRLIALWMDSQPGALMICYWTGSGWSAPTTLIAQVYGYDTATAVDGVHLLWRAFSAATGGPNALFIGKLVGITAASVPYAWATSVDNSGSGRTPNGTVALAIAPDTSLGVAFGDTTGGGFVCARALTSAGAVLGSWVTVSNTGFDTYGGLTICARGLRNSAGEYEWLVHFVNANGVNIDSFYPITGLTAWQERRANSSLVSKSFRVGDEVFAWLIERNANTCYLVGGHVKSQVCGFCDREVGFNAPEDGVSAFLPRVSPDPLTSGDYSGPYTLINTGGSGVAFDAGAASVESFTGDGYVEFTGATVATGGLGLSTTDVDAGFTTVGFGIFFGGGGMNVWESGVHKFTGTSVAGDKYKIVRTAGVITYFQNGTLVYTSATTSTGPLIADSSFGQLGGSTTHVRMYDKAVPMPLTWSAKGVTIYSESSGYGPTHTGTKHTWARQFNTGQAYVHPGNVRIGDMDFLPTLSTAAYGKSTYIAGAAVRCWDGTELGDAGFQSYPTVTSLVGASGGFLSAGDYFFRVYAVRYNKQGERFESAAFTSFKITVTLNQKITVTIQGLPCTNHSDVTLEVFRTEAGGTTFYYDGTVANSTTANTVTYVSTISDASLRTHAGDPHATGVGQISELESFGPLGCSIIASSNDRLWGAGGAVPTGAVAFSKLHNDGFGVGCDDIAGTQEVDTEGGEITSISGMGSTTVAFESNKLFVINGTQGPDNDGNGAFSTPDIVLADGAINHAGTALTQLGVVYWGDGGPRLLTRSYEVVNISVPVRLLTKTIAPTGCRVDFPRQEAVWYTANGTAVLWNYLNGSSRWARWSGLTIAGTSALALVTTDGRVLYPSADIGGDAGQEFEFRIKTGLLQAEKIIGGGTLIRALGLTGSFQGPHTIRARMFYDGSPLWSEEWIWSPQTGTYLSLGTDFSSSTPAQIDALKMINQSGSYLTHKRTARNHCAYLQVEITDQGSDGRTFVPTEITLEIGVAPGLARVSPNTFGK